jgi:hypothetical protein
MITSLINVCSRLPPVLLERRLLVIGNNPVLARFGEISAVGDKVLLRWFVADVVLVSHTQLLPPWIFRSPSIILFFRFPPVLAGAGSRYSNSWCQFSALGEVVAHVEGRRGVMSMDESVSVHWDHRLHDSRFWLLPFGEVGGPDVIIVLQGLRRGRYIRHLNRFWLDNDWCGVFDLTKVWHIIYFIVS